MATFDAKISPPTGKASAAKAKAVTPHDETLDKRMTVERGVVDELLLVCGVIGTTTDGDELVPVTDCLNWLQDLQRALRRDDDTFRPISLLLAKWKVVQQKLLPLVMTCRYDTPMVLTIVKILVILTKPLGEATKKAGRFAIDTKKYSEESVKEQINLRENAIAQSEMLMEFKRAVTHHPSHANNSRSNSDTTKGGLLSVFVSLLAEPISKTGSGRSDIDHLTIELVLHLFRNLLAAEPLIKPSAEASQRSVQLHQELVCLFESELVLEILLVVSQDMESRENQNYNLLVMELLNQIFKNQDPTAVARSVNFKVPTGANDKENPPSLLRESLKREKQKLRTVETSRHAHFGGTLVVNRPDGKRQYISAALMGEKTPPGATKRRNRKREAFVGSGRTMASHMRAVTTTNPTALRAQRTIHFFCERFVKDCYGPLFKSLKNEFRRDSVRLEEGDSVVFFRIVWFFCQWWRISRKDELGHLIFTMDVFSFKLVLGAMDNYMERKKYPQLAQAVGLYSEMMHLLHIMYSSKDSTENVMALGLLDTLFYGSEPLDRLPKLLSKWAPSTTTREYLCDLVEVVHMTLKLLETNATACLQADAVTETKGDSKAEKKRDAVARMKANAATFDPNNSYILRKIVSNQVVSIYTHLLSQYSVNAPHVNHRIIAFLMRFQKLTIAVAEEDSGGDEQLSLLSSKTVTLEPMLFNVNLLMVLEKILNDKSIRKEKDFTHLLSFAARLVRHFADAAKGNPLLYVESLFRHSAPHRFCESFTNKYVNEELRLIADRDILLEDDRRRTAEDFEEIDDNQTAAGIVRSSGSRADEVLVDSDDEEVEWVDAGQTTGRSSPSKKLKTKRKAAKKKETVLSDSEDDDESNGPPSKEETAKKRNLDSPEIYGEEQDEGVVDKTTKGSSAPAFEDSSDDEFGVASGPTSVKKTFLDDSSDEEIDFSSPRTKMTHEKSTSLGKDEHFKSSKRVREEEDGDDSAIKNRKMNTIEESSSSQNGDKGESSDEEEF